MLNNQELQEQFEIECLAYDIEIRTTKTELGHYVDRVTASMFFLFRRGIKIGHLLNGQQNS